MTILADLTPKGHDRFIPLGHSTGLVYYPDGVIRFRHVCDRTHRNAGVIICAPELNAAHVVTETEFGVTVRASVACGDCTLHGFITHSRWEPC